MPRLRALRLVALLAALAGCRDATAPGAGAYALIRGQVLLAGDSAMANADLSVACTPELDWWIITVARTDSAGRFAVTFRVRGEAADAVRRATYLIYCHFHAPATSQPAVLNVDQLVRFGPDDQPPPATDVLLRQNIPTN